MTPEDIHSQGVRALRLAAILQAILGSGAAAFGALQLSELMSFPVLLVDFSWFLSIAYLAIGAAAILTALPLARKTRWAWPVSLSLAGAIFLLPFIDMYLVYSASPGGSLHGSEGALLFLLSTLPVTLILGALYVSGRSGLES